MYLTNIQEAGANNVLSWAISNGDIIKEDQAIHGLINAETYYLVTLSDVNFFELFRLTQMYRNKVRVLTEKKATIPSRTELIKLFNGSYHPNPDDPDTKAPLYEIVEFVINNFINMALQMGSDSDIIDSSAIRLFLPMISRKFDIQIPVSFVDLIDSISDEESSKLFNDNYPATLYEIVEADVHGFKTKLMLASVVSTSIIKYNPRYDKFLKVTKYFPLKKQDNGKLYNFGLLGFSKFDELARSEVRVSLFNPNLTALELGVKRLNRINSPLHVDFAVELPIQYMQILENSFDRDVLNVNCESSMSSIIDGGITYDDFITQNFSQDDPDIDKKIEERSNQITAYRIRIAEANETLLKAIPIIIKGGEDGGDVDTTSVFSMLPAIYKTKAVITLNLEHSKKYTDHYDEVISEMFKEMLNVATGITNDILNQVAGIKNSK